MKKFYLMLFLLLTIRSVGQQFRYDAKIFDNIETLKAVEYATAPWLDNPIALLAQYNIHEGESSTKDRALLMDIFQPAGDLLSKRPAIVFVHGGAFILGSRQNEDMVALCDSFARRGYVTASIDYRLGMSANVSRIYGIITQIHVPKTSGSRALHRATQDGRAAIRFLKKNADIYRIDTTKIYLVGSSAGALIGLNNMYLDTKEIPPSASVEPELGGLDSIGHPGYGGTANAVVSYWGALENPEIIENETAPLFLVHGEEDDIVPFKKGVPLEGIVPPNPLISFNMPETYGSYCIDSVLTEKQIDHETWFVKDKKHEFYGVNTGSFTADGPNAYWDTTIWKTSEFLFDQFRPDAEFMIETAGRSIIAQNYSTANHNLLWDFGDGTTSTFPNVEHFYDLPGNYTVSLTVCDELMACDTSVQIISIEPTGIEQQSAAEKICIYPNPANELLHIKGITDPFSCEIYDLTGRLQMNRKNIDVNALHVNYLKSGIYVLKIKTDSAVISKKFIKRE